jgi:hypothetical protein
MTYIYLHHERQVSRYALDTRGIPWYESCTPKLWNRRSIWSLPIPATFPRGFSTSHLPSKVIPQILLRFAPNQRLSSIHSFLLILIRESVPILKQITLGTRVIVPQWPLYISARGGSQPGDSHTKTAKKGTRRDFAEDSDSDHYTDRELEVSEDVSKVLEEVEGGADDSTDHGSTAADASWLADTSMETTAEPKALQLFPDFAVVVAELQLRDKKRIWSSFCNKIRDNGVSESLTWADIRRLHLPVLAELKKGPTRRPGSMVKWLTELDLLLEHAALQAVSQAMCVFHSPQYQHQQQIILIAGAGEWFRVRAVNRPATETIDPSMTIASYYYRLRQFRELDEINRIEQLIIAKENQQAARDERAARHAARHAGNPPIPPAQRSPRPPFSDEEINTAWLTSHLNTQRDLNVSFLQVLPQLELSPRTTKLWSKPMRLGSPVANLYLEYVKTSVANISERVPTWMDNVR